MDPKLGPRKAAAAARVAYFSQEIARHHASRAPDPSLTQGNVDPFQRGSRVLFRHTEEGWILGTVHRAHQGRGTGKLYSIIPGDVRTTEDGVELSMSAVVPAHSRVKDLVRLKQDELLPAYDSCLVPVKDLLHIPQLHEALILHQVRRCYEKEEVYVTLGRNIVLSVNPGQDMSGERYSEETFENYVDARSSIDHGLPPHIWGTAHQMYWKCIRQSRTDRPQAMLFTGAAGSGKTEAAHLVLRFLTTISALQSNSGPARDASLWIANMMMRLGPLIDAFGNATLQRYTNSSRIIKWTEIFISAGGSLVGGQFQVFMLERSRVILPPEGERSFHSYYHLLAGIDSSVRRRLGLDDARKYEWLFRHVVVTDQDEAIDAAAYRSNRKTLSDLGLATYELDTLDKILAGIIHLRSIVLSTQTSLRSGNVEWSMEKEEAIRMTGALWGIEPHHLFAEIASTTSVGRGGAQTRRLSPVQAEEARNNVCKAVYCGLVEWLIRRINKELNRTATRTTQEKPSGIGLLDIYGHENDTHGNMLEQLLMNTVNEEIQREYYQHVFENEIEECQSEGLDMTGSIPPDPTPTIDLVTGPGGVLSILEDQARKGVSSDNAVLEQLKSTHGFHRSLFIKGDSVSGFGIKHHAGLVHYGPISTWKSRNAFVTRSSLVDMCADSSNQLVRSLFIRPMESHPPSGGDYLTTDNMLSSETLGQQYKRTMEYIRSIILRDRELSWCRCIRGSASLGGFSGSLVLSQLQAMSVLETVRVKRTCYPVRLPHDYFLSRYRNIVRGSSYDNPDNVGGISIDSVLNFAGVSSLEDSQIGSSKVFLNNSAHKKLEDLRLETPNPSKVLTSFIAGKLIAKAAGLRGKADGDENDTSPGPKGSVNISAMQQTMRVLAMHLPVFLAFARGYLAYHSLKKQPDTSVCGSEGSRRSSVVSEVQIDDDDSSYLDKGILAVSKPLRKLAEWKRNAIQKSKQHPFEPPPTTDTLKNEAIPKHPDELKGKLCSLENYIAPAALIDQGETNFRDPQTGQHDYTSIILKENEALAKMTNEELFDCLGQGKREVHAPLRLSREAIVAIKKLVQQGKLHERHCTRVKLNKRQLMMEQRGKIPGARAPLTPGGFPESLGPFVLRQCPPGVVTHVRDGRYTVPLTGSLAPLAEACVPGEGRVSPESPLTLPLEARKKAHIPRAAASFTWAYPLPGMGGLTNLGIDNNAALQFVTFGGFIYLDMTGKPISTNAVAPGEGLHFDGPHKWTYDGSRIAEIESSGRMQPVTIEPLKDVGAKYFCWLLPGEELGLDPPPSHGGFAYLFREPFEPPCPDDRYFVIVETETSANPAEAEAFSKDKKQEPSDLVELPRIEGVKELEGMVVHRRTATAIDEVIKADMLVQEVRQDMEPIVPPTQVELIKHNSTVPFNDPAILSPVRHHLRDPEEFVDVEGGYLGWNKNGLLKPTVQLNYSGEAFPFPTGISCPLSPLRSKPFFIHQMPSNSVTAFGKSVDGRRNISTTDSRDNEHANQSGRKSNIKNTWLEMYDKGLCGGLNTTIGEKKVRVVSPSEPLPLSDSMTTTMAFGVLGSHAGQALKNIPIPEKTYEDLQEEEKATRYFESIKNELDRQQFS